MARLKSWSRGGQRARIVGYNENPDFFETRVEVLAETEDTGKELEGLAPLGAVPV